MSPQLAPAASEAESHSQVIKAQLQLREMILAGELPAGERIAELTVVQRLGISRTPVRAALMRLEQEGLLEAMAGGELPGCGVGSCVGQVPMSGHQKASVR